MTENETWEYLEEIAASGSILGLESMKDLMEELGNVQNQLRFIHVAGTNGKGSVCTMVSSILAQAGFCVGKYTSPAVFGRMEQYQVNGQPIPVREFVAVVSEVRMACERMMAKGKAQPTVFEVETAAAFLYFYRRECELVVLETGMGGATDATNIIEPPLVCVLTSISMDHMKFLGDDLARIARMKAGIIKEGCRVVAVRPAQEEVRGVLEETCRQKHADLSYSEAEKASHIRCYPQGDELRQSFCYPCISASEKNVDAEGFVQDGKNRLSGREPYGEQQEIVLSMLGDYQVENAVCAIETARALREMGYGIHENAVRAGLFHASWEGRFSILCRRPLIVMDGAHNADAAKKLSETVKRGFTNRRIIYIIGVLADKEHEEMLKIMLPLAHQAYTITPGHPRAMDGQALAAEAEKYHGRVRFCPTVDYAVKQALSQADDSSVILAFGSLSYLGELRKTVKENVRDGR